MEAVLVLLAFQAWCVNLKKADLENGYFKVKQSFWGACAVRLTRSVIPAGVRLVRSQQSLANLDAFCILVLLSNTERRDSCISSRSLLCIWLRIRLQ